MQQTPTLYRLQKRIFPGLALIFFLFMLFPASGHSAFARESEATAETLEDFQPKLHVALANTPKYLVVEAAPIAGPEEKEQEAGTITPFFGCDEALTSPPTPERPAIAANDLLSLENPEFTAGVHVDMGSVKFNLGYTLPSSKVDNFVRPFGVEREPGNDDKRFSLGVLVPF